MAAEVSRTIETGEHLLVQAGTGTGKSLGYLAPALAHLAEHPDQRIVIATATLALQTQLATKDIPAAVTACHEVTGLTVNHAVLKGRSNYACLHRVRDGIGMTGQDTLLGGAELVETVVASGADATSVLGAEVVALREWAEEQATSGGGPTGTTRPATRRRRGTRSRCRCGNALGVAKCPFGSECLVEKSRERARNSQLVVTNHALLAIDAMRPHRAARARSGDRRRSPRAGRPGDRCGFPRASPQSVERVAKRCLPWLSDDVGAAFLDAADTLQIALDETEPGRVEDPDAAIVAAFATVRDAARAAVSGMTGKEIRTPPRRPRRPGDLRHRRAVGRVGEARCGLGRRARAFGPPGLQAPLSVAGLIAERILGEVPGVLTSATLRAGR